MESDSELIIEEEEENPQGRGGTGPMSQTTGSDVSVTTLEADAQLAEEIEQHEKKIDVGDTTEASVPTPEVLATAVVTAATPTSDHT